MEEKYYELREQMNRAWDAYQGSYSLGHYDEYERALHRFEEFCTDVLEKLMDENADVLKNLKMGA